MFPAVLAAIGHRFSLFDRGNGNRAAMWTNKVSMPAPFLEKSTSRFPNEESARTFFEERRWHGNLVCPHCSSVSVATIKSGKPMPYRCKDCREHFGVRTGTVLSKSKLA